MRYQYLELDLIVIIFPVMSIYQVVIFDKIIPGTAGGA